MKKITAILSIHVLFSYGLYSQSNLYEDDMNEIIVFLTKHCLSNETNPVFQTKTDEINLFVGKVFEKQYTSDDIPILTAQALQLFYDNSMGTTHRLVFALTDLPREHIRRSMCYMALAFLTDEYRYFSFLADARTTLNAVADQLRFNMRMTVDTIEDEYEELSREYVLMSKMFLIVNMIELYKNLNSEDFTNTSNYVFEHNISRFQNELKDREKDIDDTIFIAEYKKIISDIVHTRNEQQVD